VKPVLGPERDHGIADSLMLLATLCVAVVTWSYLAKISTTPLWKFNVGIGLTFLFALAGLTRHARWAITIKLLMGIWTMIAPFMLGLFQSAPLWIYLSTGTLLTALAIPGFIGQARTYRGGPGMMSVVRWTPSVGQESS
jgi:hypothetical protein